jgi:hypothetical protein
MLLDADECARNVPNSGASRRSSIPGCGSAGDEFEAHPILVVFLYQKAFELIREMALSQEVRPSGSFQPSTQGGWNASLLQFIVARPGFLAPCSGSQKRTRLDRHVGLGDDSSQSQNTATDFDEKSDRLKPPTTIPLTLTGVSSLKSDLLDMQCRLRQHDAIR